MSAKMVKGVHICMCTYKATQNKVFFTTKMSYNCMVHNYIYTQRQSMTHPV